MEKIEVEAEGGTKGLPFTLSSTCDFCELSQSVEHMEILMVCHSFLIGIGSFICAHRTPSIVNHFGSQSNKFSAKKLCQPTVCTLKVSIIKYILNSTHHVLTPVNFETGLEIRAQILTQL